jgi:hypothetical protein
MSKTNPAWMSKAECRKHDPSLWDVTEKLTGEGALKRMHEREEKARAICLTCPVLQECRWYGVQAGIENDAIEQMYGAMTPDELARQLGAKTRFSSGVLRFCDEEAA